MQKNLSFYTFFYLSSLIFMRGCGIFAKILLARSITPYEYGLITLLVIALPGTFQMITNFCFFDILGHSIEGKKYFSFSLLYGIITSFIIALIFILFPEPIYHFFNIPAQQWKLWSSILFGVLLSVTIGGVITGMLRGERSHSLAASFSTAPSIVRLVFIIVAIYIFNISDFYQILIIFALPPLAALIPVLVYKRKAIQASLKMILIPDRNILLFGFSFFILNAWVTLSQNINSLVISHDMGVTWQGYFDVSLSIVAVISFFAGALYLISVPETTVDSDNILSRRRGFADTGRLLLSMCLLCVLILYFFGQQLIVVLFTSSYSPAGEYLVILAIGYTILFIQQYCAYLSISSEKEGVSRLTILTVISIIVFPFFTHFMIINYNFLGAYLAISIFISFYTLGTILLIKDRTPLMLLFVKFDRLILSIIVTFLILYLVQLSLVPGIMTGLIVFTTMIIASGFIDKKIFLDLIRFGN
jgi:O-antigen/teichoic acid export membrane protein